MPQMPEDEKKLIEEEEKAKARFAKTDFSHHLRMSDLFALSLRTFKSQSIRTILTTLGIGVGIGTVLFLVSFGFGLQKILIEQIARTEDALYAIEAYFPSESSLTLSQKDLEEIRQIPGVKEVTPISELSGEARFGDVNGLISIKIVEESYFRLSGTIPEIGKAFDVNETGAIVISSAALQIFGLPVNATTVGKEMYLKVYEPDEFVVKEPFLIKGIIQDDTASPFILAPKESFKGIKEKFRSVLVRAKDSAFVAPVRDALFNRGTLISAKMDLIDQANQVLNVATIILGVFGVTALVVSAIGMFNTMTVALLERTYEIGIMKSLGATDTDIQRLFLMEAFLMGFFGGVAGLVIGIFGADIINFGLNMLARSFHGKPVNLFVRPWWFMTVLVAFSSLVSLFTGYWPARRSVKLSPIEAFKR